MKKLFSMFFAAFFAVAMMAGGALAGTLHLTGDQNTAGGAAAATTAAEPGYYPAEAVVGGDDEIDFNSDMVTLSMPGAVVATGTALRTIAYVPTTDLPSGTRIVLTLTNATWVSTDLYLLSDEGAADFDGVTVASTDSMVGGVATFIVGSTPVNAGDILILSASQDGVDDGARDGSNPAIALDAALATALTKVTAAVTECYDAVGAIDGGLAGAVNIFGSYQQFDFTVAAGTATINVESPDFRTTFLASVVLSTGNIHIEDHQGDADVDALLADPQVSFFAIDLNTASLATIDYTVTGGQLNKLVSPNGLVLDMDGLNGNDQAFTIVDDASATLSVATDDNAAWYNAGVENLDFTVNGTDTLDTQTFAIAGSLNFSDNTSYNDLALGSTTIMNWGINGYQAKLYLSTETGNRYSFINLHNESTSDAQVFCDLQFSDGTLWSNVGLGTLTANTSRTILGSDIITTGEAEGNTTPTGANAKYLVTFTVTGPTNNIHAWAFETRDGTQRTIAIYTQGTTVDGEAEIHQWR